MNRVTNPYRSVTWAWFVCSISFVFLVQHFGSSCCILIAADADKAQDKAQSLTADESLNQRIRDLIVELGGHDYASRLRARKELQRLGLVALDALHLAQSHPNSEIAMSARYLLGSLQVMWTTDSDPDEVREILSGYGTKSSMDRESLLTLVAQIDRPEVLPALLRAVRFETDLRLSREAAFLILGHPSVLHPENPQGIARWVREILGANARPSVQWLKAMSEEILANSIDANRWQEFIREEQHRLSSGTSRDLDDKSVLSLYQKTCERLAARNQIGDAEQLANEAILQISARSQDVLTAVQWAAKHSFWSCILLAAEQHADAFAGNSLLLYWQAHACMETGLKERGEQLSQSALALAPLVDTSEVEEMGPIDEVTLLVLDEHLRNADLLERSGRVDWAEREFRYIIERVPVWVERSVKPRWTLNTMLRSQLRYAEAAAVLEPLVERLDRDGVFAQSLVRSDAELRPDTIKLIYLYCKGMGLQEAAPSEARKAFRSVLKIDSQEVDTIIAMYRLPGDEHWKSEVAKILSETILAVDMNIKACERDPERLNLLSHYYNEFAWLVCNTEGDQDLALHRARRAVDLHPNSAAEMDTLGRCLFIHNQFNEAVRVQRQAVALSPHDAALVRQLKEFELAVEKHEATKH